MAHPEWFAALRLPDRISKRLLASFTTHRDGWVRWYRGKTRFVCPKGTPAEEVDAEWEAKRTRIDSEIEQSAIASVKARIGGVSLIEAASDFYEWLEYRVQTGQPKPLAPITACDYRRTVDTFARLAPGGLVLADRAVSSLGSDEFTAFAKLFAGSSPFTFARNVAYLQAFIRWCVDQGIIAAEPQYGRYFVKPSQQARRDSRLGQRKAYSREEVQAIAEAATAEELAWIGLGLSGALDNSDIANLTWGMIDRGAGTIDYRRRKTGRVPRLIPILPTVLDWIDASPRRAAADPEYADRVFLTPTGLPLARMVDGNPVDYLSMCWGRLLVRAGLRDPPRPRKSRSAVILPVAPRRAKGDGPGDGRGFRSLRHTFANLAPRGFRDEVELVMGHSASILLDHYLEQYGVDHLRELVSSVWEAAFSSPLPTGGEVSRRANPSAAPASSLRPGASGCTPAPGHKPRGPRSA